MLLCLAPSLRAAVVELPAAKDNTLYEAADGSLSNGAGPYLFCGTTAGGAVRRGLIAFDIAAAIPTGATILSAELRLHMSRTPTAGEFVSLHRLTADWGEGASDAFGQEGGGGPAQPGDATWLHTFYPGAFWSRPGGDFDPQPSATQVVIGSAFYTWASPQMTADAQTWLDDPSGNFGWALLGEESIASTAKRFDTREYPDPRMRPVLTVHWVPEPSGAWPALLTAVFLIGRRTSGRTCSPDGCTCRRDPDTSGHHNLSASRTPDTWGSRESALNSCNSR